MKKFYIGSIIVLIFIFLMNAKASNNLIPNEAIRMRVIPNSNSKYDQEIKLKIKDYLQEKMYQLLKNTRGIDEARNIINKNLKDIDYQIHSLLEKENYDKGYKIDFGQNYFPEKEYKGVTYEEGYYESIVVTLGSGEGDNWWCVLFPPLCLIEAEESTDVEYKFFIQELIEKYL